MLKEQSLFQVAILFLHSYQQYVTVPVVLHSYQYLEHAFLLFFLSIIIGVWYSLIFYLIYISQMTNAV